MSIDMPPSDPSVQPHGKCVTDRKAARKLRPRKKRMQFENVTFFAHTRTLDSVAARERYRRWLQELKCQCCLHYPKAAGGGQSCSAIAAAIDVLDESFQIEIR